MMRYLALLLLCLSTRVFSFAPRSVHLHNRISTKQFLESEATPRVTAPSANVTSSSSTTKSFKTLREERKRREAAQAKPTAISLFAKEANLSKPWQLSDSLGLNSTTIRFLFDIQDEISSLWAKLQSRASSFRLVVTSKVERDLRTVGLAGDYVARRASKDTERVVSTLQNTPNLLALPASIQNLTTTMPSSTSLMTLTGPPRLLGNFDATSTKQRVESFRSSKRKQKQQQTAPDALYRSITLLPNKLKYDYERRKVAQEADRQGGGFYTRPDRLLSASSVSDQNEDEEEEEVQKDEYALPEGGEDKIEEVEANGKTVVVEEGDVTAEKAELVMETKGELEVADGSVIAAALVEEKVQDAKAQVVAPPPPSPPPKVEQQETEAEVILRQLRSSRVLANVTDEFAWAKQLVVEEAEAKVIASALAACERLSSKSSTVGDDAQDVIDGLWALVRPLQGSGTWIDESARKRILDQRGLFKTAFAQLEQISLLSLPIEEKKKKEAASWSPGAMVSTPSTSTSSSTTTTKTASDVSTPPSTPSLSPPPPPPTPSPLSVPLSVESTSETYFAFSLDEDEEDERDFKEQKNDEDDDDVKIVDDVQVVVSTTVRPLSSLSLSRSLYENDDDDDEPREQEVVVVETTAESVAAPKDEQVQKLVLTGLDVIFFLLETFFKAAAPILVDGGTTVAQRAAETFFDAKGFIVPSSERKKEGWQELKTLQRAKEAKMKKKTSSSNL